MSDLLEGILLPFTLAWSALRWAGHGIAHLYKLYIRLTAGLSPGMAKFVHSTVFMSLGQGLVWLVLQL